MNDISSTKRTEVIKKIKALLSDEFDDDFAVSVKTINNGFSTKLDITLSLTALDEAGEAVNTQEIEFVQNSLFVQNLEADDYDLPFTLHCRTYYVKGYKSRNRKYPLIAGLKPGETRDNLVKLPFNGEVIKLIQRARQSRDQVVEEEEYVIERDKYAVAAQSRLADQALYS